jgi:hypothetical protein
MPWEHRNGRGRYYTRTRKINGVVTRQYVGAGPLAELVAHADDLTRQALTAESDAVRRLRAQTHDFERRLDNLCRLTDHLIHIELTAAGYHQHARGAWRKRRNSHVSAGSAISPIPQTATLPPTPAPNAVPVHETR